MNPLPSMKARSLLVAALLAAFATAGCAQKRSPANWQNPNVPKESWSEDTGECRRYAKREMEREAGLTTGSAVEDNLGGGLSSYQQSMNRYDLSKIQQKAFDSCMRRLGYAPIVGK
jgi:hypothetical protein